MLVTLSQIKAAVATIKGLKQFADLSAENQVEVELRINQIQDFIFFDKPYEFRRRTKHFTTRPPYETGTITATAGSRIITGSGTTWLPDMQDGVMFINNKFYKIDSVNSTTSITLKAAIPEDASAGSSYKIVFPYYPVHPDFTAITDVILDGAALDVKPRERRYLNFVGVAEPSEAIFVEINDTVHYQTGTVAITTNTTAVTGTGTAWTSAMEGKIFRVAGWAEDYVIKTVSSATALILERAYRGSTVTTSAYQINPEGIPLIRLQDAPDDYYFIEVEGLTRPRMLINDDDISLVPDHAPLLHGAMYLAYADMEDRNPFLVQQKRADFERSLKQLRDTYKAITNIRWTSAVEVTDRHIGTTSRFNPLSDN